MPSALQPPATPNAPHSWPRLDGIDLLRALAIFYVLLNHVNMRLLGAHIRYLRGLSPWLTSALVWKGQEGVQIFFAVSGFLITSTALRRWGSLGRIRLRDFYILRAARILPLLLALLAVLSLLDALHLHDFTISARTGGLPRALFAALTFHVGLLEATRGYLPANWDILWSLGVEEVFYLGFPIACVLLGRRRLGRLNALALLLFIFVALGPFARTVLSHGNEVWQEYSYLGGADAISLGCLTALLLARRTPSRRALKLSFAAGLALLVFCLGFSPAAARLHLYSTGLFMSLVALGACLLIAVFSQSRWPAPNVLQPILALGRRSYEVYLTHMFVVFALFHLWLDRTAHARSTIPLLFLAAIVCAGLLGSLLARFFTEPANRRLRAHFGDGPRRLGSALSPADPLN